MGALVALAVALFSPTATGAVPVSWANAFTVKGSNGYTMYVAAVPAHRGRPAAVKIEVWGKQAVVVYSTKTATVTETSVQVDLGELGEIDVAYKPSGVVQRVRPSCGGPAIPIENGHYEGTISFHGEEGYTAVEATSAPADFDSLLNVICGPVSDELVTSGLPGARLSVQAGQPSEPSRFSVIKNRPAGRARFVVGVDETRGSIQISRILGLLAPPRSFRYDPDLRIATVRPPAPFAGAASFHREATATNRWSGNLTVDLPGRSDMRLTGGHERVEIIRAHSSWSSPRRDGGDSSHGSSLALREHSPASARADGRW